MSKGRRSADRLPRRSASCPRSRAPVMHGATHSAHGARALSPALPARRPAGCGSGPRWSNPGRRRCAGPTSAVSNAAGGGRRPKPNWPRCIASVQSHGPERPSASRRRWI